AGPAAFAFGVVAGVAACFGAVFAAVLAVFFAFVTLGLTAFLAVFFLAVFLATFFFTPRLALVRVFAAAADLRAPFLPAFLAAFFLAIVFVRVATACILLELKTDCRDLSAAEIENPYRVASASMPNTEKTSGFRSRL